MHRLLLRQLDEHLANRAEPASEDLLQAISAEYERADRDRARLAEAEERLLRHAHVDEATGYPNRNLLVDRLQLAIARKEATHKPFAIVAVSVDAFDRIADSFGHDHCELTVAAVANRIAAIVSPVDTVARIRKDQLCVLVEAAPDLSRVLRLTDRVQRAVGQPLKVMGEDVFTSVSIGIVVSDGPTRNPEDYLQDAVVAMHRAAETGAGGRTVFDNIMQQQAQRLLKLDAELRRAIDNHELVVYYQPIISLQTGSVAGFEALLRWNHPERGVLAPGAFIDVAEAGGHLPAIFDQIFPTILNRVQTWQARVRNNSVPFVNVNLSRSQFKDPQLLSRIDRALAQVSLAPHTVGFEMTESVMVEDQRVIETLEQLKHRQVRLLLDDFGTGYSCLSNLRQFPLDSIKIDKSFMTDAGKSPQDGEIARAITTLSHSLTMDVTVEGIETETQLRFAYNLGCEYAQGYHFARPMPADDAGKLLQRAYRTSLLPPSSGTRPRQPQTRGRVLIVDGDSNRQLRLRGDLTDNDLEVVQAFDGHDGLTRAQADLPDVVLVASDLATMGAVAFCRRLRGSDDTSTIPILLVTHAETKARIVAECLDLGATDCVAQNASKRLLLARVSAQIALSHAERKLRTMAMTDEQTGVFTRRFLFQAIRRSIKATVRSAPRGLACLVVDADDFKHVNATRGHIEADALLRRIATAIDRTTRETDLVGRFGGAEFVVLLQNTDLDGARRAAEKIREAVHTTCDTTVSIGGAVLKETSTDEIRHTQSVDEIISTLLHTADQAKFRAKKNGKNRVVFDTDAEPQIA